MQRPDLVRATESNLFIENGMVGGYFQPCIFKSITCYGNFYGHDITG